MTSQCEHASSGSRLERYRPQPGAPAQRQRHRSSASRRHGRHLVAGQHQLDLEVELVVRRRSASTPGAPRTTRRPGRNSSYCRRVSGPMRTRTRACWSHTSSPATAPPPSAPPSSPSARLGRRARADTTRRRTARPRTARRSSPTRAARAPPPTATASTAARRRTAATRRGSGRRLCRPGVSRPTIARSCDVSESRRRGRRLSSAPLRAAAPESNGRVRLRPRPVEERDDAMVEEAEEVLQRAVAGAHAPRHVQRVVERQHALRPGEPRKFTVIRAGSSSSPSSSDCDLAGRKRDALSASRSARPRRRVAEPTDRRALRAQLLEQRAPPGRSRTPAARRAAGRAASDRSS